MPHTHVYHPFAEDVDHKRNENERINCVTSKFLTEQAIVLILFMVLCCFIVSFRLG